MTFEQALIAVLTPLGDTYARRNGVFVISKGADVRTQRGGVVPTALGLQIIPAARAAVILRVLFPEDQFRVDSGANAVIAVADTEQIGAIRAVLQSIDAKNPLTPGVDAITLRFVKPNILISRLRTLFPDVRFSVASKTSVIMRGDGAGARTD